MKKTFTKKRAPTISEAQVNKSSNIRNPSIIRITTDKAIKTDRDGVKRIQKYLEKNPNAGIDDILRLAVDYGDGTTNFKVINVEKSDIKYDDVVIVDDRTLRISKTQVIRGPPHLIVKAYDYVKKNPSIVSTPEKIITRVDEPRSIRVNTVEEDDDPDNTMGQLAKKDLNDRTKSAPGEKIQGKIAKDEIELSKEIIPQLYLIDETVLDSEVESDAERHLKSLGLLQKYNALGLMIREKIPENIIEKVETLREEIGRRIDTDLPMAIDTNVFPDYSKRRPPLEKKYNPFIDTIDISDTSGNIITRKPSAKLQKRMTLDSKKREELGISSALIDVNNNVTRETRNYMQSELYDLIYKSDKAESINVEKVDIPQERTLFTKAEFYKKRMQSFPKTRDLEGEKLYSQFSENREGYMRSKNLSEKSIFLNHMTDAIVSTFLRLYPKVYAMYPYEGHDGFYERINTRKQDSFQANFRKHITRNLASFTERDSTIEKSFKKIGDGFDDGMYNTVDPKKYNTARIDNDKYEYTNVVVSNRKIYTGDKIADNIRRELAYYISNNLNADYKSFMVFPDSVNPTAAELHKIDLEYAEYKKQNQPQDSFVEIIEPDEPSSISVKLPNIVALENHIYSNNDSILDYFYKCGRVLQFFSSNTNTVSKYSKSLLQRIALGDVSVQNLYNMDYRTLLPEFFLNSELDIPEFDRYMEYSQKVAANDSLNVWIFTQTHKQINREWYQIKKITFNPEKYIVPIEKICGTIDSTVFVKSQDGVKCISRKELRENIAQYEKENTDELQNIVNVGVAPISQFAEFIDAEDQISYETDVSVKSAAVSVINYDTAQFKKLMTTLVGMPGPKTFNVNIKRRVATELDDDVENDLLTQEEVDSLDDYFYIGEKGRKITQEDVNKFVNELDEYTRNPIFGLAYLYVNEGIVRGNKSDFEIKWKGLVKGDWE